MDELIYLSAGKLEQFLLKPGRLPLRQVSAALKLPFGELSIGSAGSDGGPFDAAIKKLERVRSALLGSERSPYWYEEGGLEPGNWVQFETELSCTIVSLDGHDWVFFVQPGQRRAGVQLLLHGSVGSLVPRRVPTNELDASMASTPEGLSRFLKAVADDNWGVNPGSDWVSRAASMTMMECRSRALGYVYVEGWAKVTSLLQIESDPGQSSIDGEGLMLASPLYIRHFAAGL